MLQLPPLLSFLWVWFGLETGSGASLLFFGCLLFCKKFQQGSLLLCFLLFALHLLLHLDELLELHPLLYLLISSA